MTVDDRVVALVTFAVHKNGAEIVTLDAMTPRKGYGRIALKAALDELLRRGVFHVWLYTTNDNLAAQHVYLALGWRLVHVHLDAMDRVRSLKPDVPLIGLNGLPLTDMWMFEKFLFPTDDEGIQ